MANRESDLQRRSAQVQLQRTDKALDPQTNIIQARDLLIGRIVSMTPIVDGEVESFEKAFIIGVVRQEQEVVLSFEPQADPFWRLNLSDLANGQDNHYRFELLEENSR